MYAKVLLVPILLIGTYAAQDNSWDMDDLLASVFKSNARSTTATSRTSPSVRALERRPSLPRTSNMHSYQKCGERKECVREFLCLNRSVITDGTTLIDVRVDRNASVAECAFLETCCSIEDKVDVPIIRPVDTPNACGYQNFNGVGIQIRGYGNEAQFGEFPWMVAILRKQEAFYRILSVYQCGGSLITPQVVLTAAHCVQGRPANDFKVRAGEWEPNSENEPYPYQERNAMQMIVHENHNKDNLHNDVALLFVDIPFDLAPHINTICLPPAYSNFDFSRCYATGWGKDKFQNGQYQNILKKIDLPILPNTQCQTNLRSTRLGRYFQLHSSFICAGGERGKDTCQGDGGSPLMCPMTSNPNRFFQVGIVAWGIGCADENIPAVYVNVAYFRRWIDEQLAYKGIGPAFFTA